jgi:hypothetical protein
MVKRSVASTRMKDFYDLQVLSQVSVRRQDLQRSGSKNIPESRHRIAYEPHAVRLCARILRPHNKKRLWTTFCAKNATCMAKTEFNTLIETLKMFLVPVVAAVHERTLFSQQWRPGGAWRGIGPADLRDGCKIQCPPDRSNRTLFPSLSR